MAVDYAGIVATLALGASLFGLWLHWRRYRMDREDRQPEITWSTARIPELPGWTSLRITVRNRADLAITADSIRVLWPLASRIAEPRSARLFTHENPWQPTGWKSPEPTFRRMPMRLRVAHAGTAAVRLAGNIVEPGSGDTHSIELLLSGRSSSSAILLMRLSASRKSFRVASSMIRAQIVAAEQTKSTQDEAMN